LSNSNQNGALVMPKKITAVVAIISTICSFAHQSAAEVHDLSQHHSAIDENPQLADRVFNLYRTKENLCGPIAAFLALRDFGQPMTIDAIVEEMSPGLQGISMLSLSHFFEAKGFKTISCEMKPSDAQSLVRDFDSVNLIALVNGNHWVYLKSNQNRMMYYDYPKWCKYDANDQSMLFDGPILIVGDPDQISDVRLRSDVSRILVYAVPLISVAFCGILILKKIYGERFRTSLSKIETL
jgi:hypothetical protein